jgi:hypothetical protein
MSYHEFVVRRPTLHEIALNEAERLNPGGEHVVTGIDIDGNPDDGPGVAQVTVATRMPIDAQMVAISVVPPSNADR